VGGTNQEIQEALWKYENVRILGFMIYGNNLIFKIETVLQIYVVQSVIYRKRILGSQSLCIGKELNSLKWQVARPSLWVLWTVQKLNKLCLFTYLNNYRKYTHDWPILKCYFPPIRYLYLSVLLRGLVALTVSYLSVDQVSSTEIL